MNAALHKKCVFSQPIGKQKKCFISNQSFEQSRMTVKKKSLCQFLSTDLVTYAHLTILRIPLIMDETAKSRADKYSRSAGIHLL